MHYMCSRQWTDCVLQLYKVLHVKRFTLKAICRGINLLCILFRKQWHFQFKLSLWCSPNYRSSGPDTDLCKTRINCDISSTIFLTISELTSSEHFIKKIKCTTNFLSNLCRRSLVPFFFFTSMSITIINASIMQQFWVRKKYEDRKSFYQFIHIVILIL